MIIANTGNLEIDPEILKNPQDFVRINGKFYKKTDPKIKETDQGWVLYNEKLYGLNDATGKKCLLKSLTMITFINNENKTDFIFTNNIEKTISNKKNFEKIFHDFKNKVSTYDKNKVNTKLAGEMPIYRPNKHKLNIFNKKPNQNFIPKIDQAVLKDSLMEVIVSENEQACMVRIDQVEKLGFIKILGDAYSVYSKKLYNLNQFPNIPTKGSYIKCKINKFDKNKLNLNSISKDDLTFGVEIETSHGCINTNQLRMLNIDVECARDGSITGGEYVTGILNKDKGFYDLYKLISVIDNNCNTNDSCGIHVHVGNVVFNKKFINLAYILGCKIEKELFKTLLHPSRTNNVMCGSLLKSHYNVGVKAYEKFSSKKVADKFFYSYLYDKMLYDKQFLSSTFNKSVMHPGNRYCGRYQDPFGGQITHDQFRYKWLNLITANFNQRNVGMNNTSSYPHNYLTLEFRPYHASLDYEEIQDWVLFCKAFVKYIINKSYKILEGDVSIKDIITESYDTNLFERMINRKPKIGRKNTYPKDMSFSNFLKHNQKINKNQNLLTI
jgi:hypothetical protein